MCDFLSLGNHFRREPSGVELLKGWWFNLEQLIQGVGFNRLKGVGFNLKLKVQGGGVQPVEGMGVEP